LVASTNLRVIYFKIKKVDFVTIIAGIGRSLRIIFIPYERNCERRAQRRGSEREGGRGGVAGKRERGKGRG
jgi:hypothetical protein